MFYRKVRDEVEVTNSSYLIREQEGIRILVAFEDDYRAYREVIAAGIALLRPSIEVATTGSEELAQEIARINPQVIVISQSEVTSPAPVEA